MLVIDMPDSLKARAATDYLVGHVDCHKRGGTCSIRGNTGTLKAKCVRDPPHKEAGTMASDC